MPTVIDSLLVTLGLKSDDFEKGKDKVEKGLDKTGKKADSTAKKVAGFLAALGGTMAIRRFAEQAIESSAALERLSINLGVNIEKVSAYGQAVEQAGGSSAGLQGSLDMLSKAQTDLMLTGESGLIPYLSALGLSMTDAYGKALPVTDLLTDIGQALMEKAPDRATAFNMGRSMGIDGGTLNLILKGRNEVEATRKKLEEFQAVTKRQGEESVKLDRLIVESRQSFEAFGRALLSSATPYLEKMFEVFAAFGAWARDNKEFVEAFLLAITVGLVGLAAAVTPINLVLAAVVALTAGIAALWQDYQVWKRGGESLIPWDKWKPEIDAAAWGIRWIRDLLLDLSYRAIAAGDYLAALFAHDFDRMKIAKEAVNAGMGITPGDDENWEKMTASWRQKQKAAEGNQAPQSQENGSPNSGEERKRFISSASRLMGTPEAVIDAHLRSETGAAGRSTIGDFNYGNIKTSKSWTGESKSRDVLEYDAAGNKRTESAAFRSYGSPESAAADYAALISRRYPGASGASSAEEYARALKAGGYATDPDYVSKIARIGKSIPGASGKESETEKKLSPPVMPKMPIITRIPGASEMAANAGAAAAAPASNTSNVTNQSKVDTHIGAINVVTSEATADGVAKGIGKSMDFLFTSQANYGMVP